MSVPNRAQDPKRQASYVVKEPKTAFGKRRLMAKQAAQGYEALKSPKKPLKTATELKKTNPDTNRRFSQGGPAYKGPDHNPISKTDLNIVRSGASGAFKKMGMKTPIERAKARESRPGKPPLPGF